MIRKFGPEIVEREKIVAHDCGRVDQLTALGTLPSGGELLVNRMAVEADLLCAEGFIEPHFLDVYKRQVIDGGTYVTD